MGLRFRKSVKLPLGFRINFSKSGVGYSWGVKGYRKTYTADGRERTTYSIPGTGISYVEESKKNSSKKDNYDVSSSSSEYLPGGNAANMKNISVFKIVAIAVVLIVLLLAGVSIIGNNDEKNLPPSTFVGDDGDSELHITEETADNVAHAMFAVTDNGESNISIEDSVTHQNLSKLSASSISDKEETYNSNVLSNYSDDASFIDVISAADNIDGGFQNAPATASNSFMTDSGETSAAYTSLTEEEKLIINNVKELISSGNTADAYESLLRLGDSIDARI